MRQRTRKKTLLTMRNAMLRINRRDRRMTKAGQLLEDQELPADTSVEAAAPVLVEQHPAQGAHAGADERAGAGVTAE